MGRPNHDPILKVSLAVLGLIGYLLTEIYHATCDQVASNTARLAALETHIATLTERVAHLER